MNSWKRASRDMVRIFFSNDQHIAVVLGRKPRQCGQIELVDITKNPKAPILSVHCTCQEISNHASNRGLETYCLVKPVFAGPRKQYINLLHRDGSELVPVEAISDSITRQLGKLSSNAVPGTASNEPSMVDVVSMGAMYGGFSGYSRLFVRIEQSKILDLASASRLQSFAPRNEKPR